ncbi:MAG: sigma-70 family RNA polymerase sigma factor [Chloroflexi bacterium]|nr:sigma-70 family RNA polymerase sigma factor [Chloroflexota bacterium]
MIERTHIRLARQGDADAYGQLVTRHQQAVFNIAYRITGNRQEAEDVAQESFVKAYRALGRFDTERPFAPWLYRIATNTALNWVKRRRPEVTLDEETPLADPSPGPEAQAIAADTSARLRAAIAALPPNYRVVIELRHFQGLSYQEMSDALNVPVSDVKSWLFRARCKLKKVLLHEKEDK